MHDELRADDRDMIHARSRAEVEARRAALFLICANGVSSVSPSQTASKKLVSGCSALPALIRSSGDQWAPPTPWNGSMRNSADGSRSRRCCPLLRPGPCCSGLCWHQDRSRCIRWMDGQLLHRHHQLWRDSGGPSAMVNPSPFGWLSSPQPPSPNPRALLMPVNSGGPGCQGAP